MKSRLIILAVAIAIGSVAVNDCGAQQRKPLFPQVADITHATPTAAKFFESFFTAKSRHDVDATMNHFSKTTLTYIDATLGWPMYTYDALKNVFMQYMPKWPPAGLSYPTLILGDEHSALVAFTDTPELFGGEIRALAAVDIKDGKVIRWIDYWDSRNFGAELAAKIRTPSDKFPTDFKESTAPDNAAPTIRAAAGKLQATFAGNDPKAAAALFSSRIQRRV